MNSKTRTTLKPLAFALLATAMTMSTLVIAESNRSDDGRDRHKSLVFTSSNATGANELLIYADRGAGRLKLVQRIATGGQGSGAALGSQGAVTLSSDGDFVFVVNALSQTLSTFEIDDSEIRLASVVQSGGLTPISVTEHDGLVYVLNAGGDGNIAGFRNNNGQLKPLADGLRPLSKSGGTAPAQVGFDPDGDVLVVTEKGTNLLTSYSVKRNGTLSLPVITPSSGATPFGFAFDRRDHLFVSEAFGGAANASALSSYGFGERPATKPALLSASVPTTQTAACWVAVTPNGRYVYAANAGSESLSSYTVQRSGKVNLLAAVAGHTPAGSHPIDTAIAGSGKEIYVLSAATHTLSAFRIGADGDLSSEVDFDGLPINTAGLAVK